MINWFLEKDKIQEIIDNGSNYNDIAKIYNVSYDTVRTQCRKIGVFLTNAKIPKSHKCINCENLIYGNEKQIYCSIKCQKEYQSKIKYKNYLEHQEEFVKKEISYNWLKPFILKEQNNECGIEGCHCGTEWNGKELHFVLDHIDGDATNNKRENLRLVCPNCDSQLDTFKSRNKGKSTRKYKPYVEGKLIK